MSNRVVVGLVGQPNVGKSTLFNVLTGGNAIVTNWPGTTVEKNEGRVLHRGYEVVIVDLPGIYGLSYLTPEERITRSFITSGAADLVVVLVDSLALERTLYLAVEIRELTGKVVVAVTKVDEAHSKGIHINYELLEKRLGVPVIPVSAIKKHGIATLLDVVVNYAGREVPLLRVGYGELEPFIGSLESILQQYVSELKYPVRWLAVKFLEGDAEVEVLLKNIASPVYLELERIRDEARRRVGADLAAFTSIKRINFIQGYVVKGALVKAKLLEEKPRVHKLFYNPYVAPLISIALVLGLFLLVFTINTGYPLTALLEHLGYSELAEALEKHTLSSLMERLFELLGNVVYRSLGETPLASFIVDGVLGGIASVLVFVPLIAIVMAVLGSLEDSGVLPRLAIGTHALFQRIGLSGHSLLPLTLSLGCNVPGVMSARASPNARERLKLALLVPFIPCQARLVVLLAIASAIGGFTGALLVPLVYFVSFTIFALLSYTIYVFFEKKRGVEVELLLEIPPLHRPYARVVWWFTWFYTKHFLVKAGTVILLVNIVSWGLQHFTLRGAFTSAVEESIAAEASRFIAPLLSPLGISGSNAWIAAYAVLVGFLAKELVISAVVTATGTLSPRESFSLLGLSEPSAVAFALFVALYIPCAATVATVYSETKSLKYAAISVALMLTVAYVLGTLAYNIASLLV